MSNEPAGPIGIVKGDDIVEAPKINQPEPKAWTASAHLAHATEIPPVFVAAVQGLEKSLGLTVVLLVQQGIADQQGQTLPYESIDQSVAMAMSKVVRQLPKDRPVGLLIESPGGYAREAFILARLLQRHCGGFTALVPKYAKSAATLLALGADKIVMDDDAELGPIDAQVIDLERERIGSALDEVQSLERLHAQALNLIDSTMLLLIRRARKRTDVVLPHVLHYVTQTMRPLYEKIDTVHFTSTSRTLKVAEAYATRLLSSKYPDTATRIAERLVYDYPDHGFVIDHAEAAMLGIEVESFQPAERPLIEAMLPYLDDFTAVGPIVERRKSDAA